MKFRPKTIIHLDLDDADRAKGATLLKAAATSRVTEAFRLAYCGYLASCSAAVAGLLEARFACNSGGGPPR